MSLKIENKIYSKQFTNKLEYYSNGKMNKNEDQKKIKMDRSTIKQTLSYLKPTSLIHQNSSINIKNSDNLDIEYIKQKLINLDQNNSDEEHPSKEISKITNSRQLKSIPESKVHTGNKYKNLKNNPFVISVKDKYKNLLATNQGHLNFEKKVLNNSGWMRNSSDEYVSLNNHSRNQILNHRKTTKNVYIKNKNKIKNEAEGLLIKSQYSNSENQFNTNNNIKNMPNIKNYKTASSSVKEKKILKIISVSDSKNHNLLNIQKSNCIKKGFIEPNPFHKFSSCSYKKVMYLIK